MRKTPTESYKEINRLKHDEDNDGNRIYNEKTKFHWIDGINIDDILLANTEYT